MVDRLRLSRDQLATFLKDAEQIKQFERLFGAVDEMVVSGETSLASSETAINELAAVVAALPADIAPPLPDIAAVESRVAALEQLPPVVVPLALSGFYTPTLTNVANLSASTAYPAQWLRVGDMVAVSGRVDVDPTVAAVSTQLGMSLPVTTNLANDYECAGTASASGVAAQGAAILGDAANDRAQMQWVAGDITNQAMYFSFSYRVI